MKWLLLVVAVLSVLAAEVEAVGVAAVMEMVAVAFIADKLWYKDIINVSNSNVTCTLMKRGSTAVMSSLLLNLLRSINSR